MPNTPPTHPATAHPAHEAPMERYRRLLSDGASYATLHAAFADLSLEERRIIHAETLARNGAYAARNRSSRFD